VEPIPCDKFKDCKETIKKVYLLQRPDKAPNEISVTNEFISWSNDESHYDLWTGVTTVKLNKNTI